MAATAQEAEVMERRLRPVYDAIDNGQNKKALQQADKILKKYPTLHCAKALKALVLLRMGRSDEGTKLVDKVIDTNPGDTATLQAVFMYCREAGDYKKLVLLYESAARSYPTNEDILTHLFMAYVRVDDYQNQQKTAVQLAKLFPTNAPYYCWRVMSTLMQAHSVMSSDPVKANTMYLPLAEKLMEKYVIEKRSETEAEIRLYLMILEDMGKHKKRLDLVTGEQSEKIRYPEELLSHELSCLTALKEWNTIAVRLCPLIIQSPDSWNYLKLYITAQINQSLVLRETCDANHEDATNSITSSDCSPSLPWLSPIYEAKTLLDDLMNNETNNMCRGPGLGQLLLLVELNNNGIVTTGNNFSTLVSVLVNYFKRFSSKNCCYDDIKSYLDVLNQDEKNELIRILEEFISENPINFDCNEDDIKANIYNLYRHIVLSKVKHHCGVYNSLSVDQKLKLVEEYKKKFEDGLAFGLSLPATVNQHSDYYIIQATHLLLEVFEETNDHSTLWECCVMLETASRQSRTNPQLQLLLIKIYGYLGPVEFCTRLYNSLAIKHIQIDTLGYLTNRYIQAMGAFGFAGQLFRIALRFYATCNKETMDHITSAYKNGVFNKIVEMIKLRDRIQQSLVFFSLGVESFQQEFLDEAVSMKQVRTIFTADKPLQFSFEDVDDIFSSFTDNRDLEVFDVWSSQHLVTKEERSLTFILESIWVKLKITIIQSLKLLITMETRAPKDIIISKLDELTTLITTCQNHDGIEYLRRKKTLLLPVQAPPPCQLFLFITSKYSQLLMASIKTVRNVLFNGNVNKEHSLSVHKILKDIINSINGIPSDIQKQIASSSDDLWTNNNNPYQFLLEIKVDIESYVLLIIVCSWLIVMFGTFIDNQTTQLIVPVQGSVNKKKTLKQDITPSLLTTEDVVVLNDILSNIKASLLLVCTKYRPMSGNEKWLVEKLTKSTDSTLNATDQVRAAVYGGVLESYNTSFSDCQEVVQNLVKLIDSIIQTTPTDVTKPLKVEKLVPSVNELIKNENIDQ